MSTANRQPYLTSTSLDQSFLNDCHDNLVNQLEMVVDIESPSGTLHLSDRNKYVGSTFYEARLQFPIIQRTIGEFLSPTLEFSQLQLEINNSDGRFNDILPAGSNYDGWIGREVIVKIGLRDVASTYKEIFRGRVTDQGGFQRTVKSFTLIARNDFERINVSFPKTILKATTYPDIDPEFENIPLPLVYGDWTQEVEHDAASIPAFPVNTANPNVDGSTSFTVSILCVVSENDNSLFDSNNVYLLRGELFYKFNSSDIYDVTNNKSFKIKQSGNGGVTTIEGEAYNYQRGDKFYCRVKGKNLGAYSDNIVEIGRDILISQTGLLAGDFDSNWNTIRDKNAPAESAIASIKARVWIQEPQEALTYVLSLLEQVRLEAFIDKNLKMKLRSLHFEDFVANPSFEVKNWDIEAGSFSPKIDDRNNFNRARGSFNFLPNRNENAYETGTYRNQAAIDQAGKVISKRIICPNLYVMSDVSNQVENILKFASSYIEIIDCSLTWRSMLLDLGDFVKINVNIQGTVFDGIPAMVREIGFDPAGVKIPVKLWSFQLMPFTGYSPTYSGIVGGSTAIINQE